MNKKVIILGVFFLIPIMVISFRSSYALFISSASNSNNTFSALSVFPTAIVTATPTPATHVVINEFSSHGNNKVEWVELYNPPGVSIDLSGWLIGNGALNDPLPSGSSISADGFAVILPTNSDVTGIPASATTIILTHSQIGNGLTDTGDTLVLKNAASTVVDQLSYGTNTAIFPTPPIAPASGQSLARSPNGVDTDTAVDWVIDSTPTIGSTNL